jgi:hypothetical protein
LDGTAQQQRDGDRRRNRDVTLTAATAMEGAMGMEGVMAMDGTTVTVMATVVMDEVAWLRWMARRRLNGKGRHDSSLTVMDGEGRASATAMAMNGVMTIQRWWTAGRDGNGRSEDNSKAIDGALSTQQQ